MSITEPADGAQPDGQGDGGEPGGQPYADYLTRVPEEVRETIEPIFKDWNSSVNNRFQEHAEYRKGWEPYEQVKQHQPEAVAEALQLYQVALNDPKAFQQWFEQYSAERGLTPAQAAQQLEQTGDGTFDQYDPQKQLQQMLEQKLSPLEQRLQALFDRDEAREQKAHEAKLADEINQEIGKLKETHGKNLPAKVRDQIEDIVERFGMRYAQQPGITPAQVVQKAWADFEALSNQLQTGALQTKVDQPDAPLTGDTADGAIPAYTKGHALQEANKIAMEQMRASRNA